MNFLEQYFYQNKNNAIHKWVHYFDIYDLYFKKYRDQEVVILEIGVFQGGSLKMWKEYFGEKAKIYAIDINPLCKQFETDSIKIFIGSQEDRDFLKMIKNQIPEIDILIDDGGHEMQQQIVAFEELYDHIKLGGIYVCEDLHTSYWNQYGGGYRKPGSFIEYSKNFIDYINAWHVSNSILPVNNLTKSMYSLHYYDSVLVVEKQDIKPPECKMTGEILIPIDSFPLPGTGRFMLKNKYLKAIKSIYHRFVLKIIKTQKSIYSIDRFQATERAFLKKKLFIHDIASYELGLNEIFKHEIYKFQARRSNPTIVDCGANLGMSVIYFKQLYPDASIIAFEADPHIFGFLQKNVESFGYENVELVKAAVWDSEGSISFQPDGGAGGRVVSGESNDNLSQVNTVRLRDVLTQHKVDFLKIDIEGAEDKVINDCKDILGNIDFLFIEYHSMAHQPQQLHEILRIVHESGFRYHIKEAFTRKYPFVSKNLNYGMDLQLNIFCSRE